MKRSILIIGGLSIAAIGFAVWYFKFRKPKEAEAPIITTKIPLIDKVVSAATILKKETAPVVNRTPTAAPTALNPVLSTLTARTSYLPQTTK